MSETQKHRKCEKSHRKCGKSHRKCGKSHKKYIFGSKYTNGAEKLLSGIDRTDEGRFRNINNPALSYSNYNAARNQSEPLTCSKPNDSKIIFTSYFTRVPVLDSQFKNTLAPLLSSTNPPYSTSERLVGQWKSLVSYDGGITFVNGADSPIILPYEAASFHSDAAWVRNPNTGLYRLWIVYLIIGAQLDPITGNFIRGRNRYAVSYSDDNGMTIAPWKVLDEFTLENPIVRDPLYIAGGFPFICTDDNKCSVNFGSVYITVSFIPSSNSQPNPSNTQIDRIIYTNDFGITWRNKSLIPLAPEKYPFLITDPSVPDQGSWPVSKLSGFSTGFRGSVSSNGDLYIFGHQSLYLYDPTGTDDADTATYVASGFVVFKFTTFNNELVQFPGSLVKFTGLYDPPSIVGSLAISAQSSSRSVSVMSIKCDNNNENRIYVCFCIYDTTSPNRRGIVYFNVSNNCGISWKETALQEPVDLSLSGSFNLGIDVLRPIMQIYKNRIIIYAFGYTRLPLNIPPAVGQLFMKQYLYVSDNYGCTFEDPNPISAPTLDWIKVRQPENGIGIMGHALCFTGRHKDSALLVWGDARNSVSSTNVSATGTNVNLGNSDIYCQLIKFEKMNYKDCKKLNKDSDITEHTHSNCDKKNYNWNHCTYNSRSTDCLNNCKSGYSSNEE